MASPTGSGSGSKRPQRAVAQRLAPGAYTEQLVLSTEGNPYRVRYATRCCGHDGGA